MKTGMKFFEMLNRLTFDSDGLTAKEAEGVAKEFDLKSLLSPRNFDNFLKLGGDSRYLVRAGDGSLNFNSDVQVFLNDIYQKLNASDQDTLSRSRFEKQFRYFKPKVPKENFHIPHLLDMAISGGDSIKNLFFWNLEKILGMP